jgi:ADP-heptose:LPS heptosyltransferase
LKTLLAGPWLGEFGWEIMTWVPAIRKYSRKFDETIIVCKVEHEYLYRDFAKEFIFHEKKGLPDRWLLNSKKVKMPELIIRNCPKTHVVQPTRSICSEWKREYLKYGIKRKECAYDLVIHARACDKYGQRSWNWPKPRYRKVIEALKPERVCCIGTEAHYIDNTEDMRNFSLNIICDVLASSKVLLTPSSGPGHLASLCGCPQVIMTDNKYQKSIKGTNKDRYKHIWNPFDTPCKVLDEDNWQPSIKKVVKALEKYL